MMCEAARNHPRNGTRTRQAHQINTLCRVLRRHGEYLLLLLLVASLLLLVACAGSSASRLQATPTLPSKWHGVNPGEGIPTATSFVNPAPRLLPAFTDPRVAYIGPDSLLHVVSLDGKMDLSGTPIPLEGTLGDGLWAVGASPDDRHLAYFDANQVTTVDAASGARKNARLPNVAQSTASWSPDQRYVALYGPGAIECVNVTSSSSFETPGDPLTLIATSKWLIANLAGWLDATHVAVTTVANASGTPGTHGIPPTVIPGSPETYVTLASLNITTNQLRTIATVQKGGSVGTFTVLPGGQWSLFSNVEDSNQSYTPQVALINNATGAVTPLRHLTSLLTPRGFNSILWRPYSTQAIVDTGFPAAGDNHYLLIDALRDTATPISLPGFPEAWSPDGSTLVVASGPQASNPDGIGWNNVGEVGAGPFTLIAVRISAGGLASTPITLTTHAMNIPTLGFVHTA